MKSTSQHGGIPPQSNSTLNKSHSNYLSHIDSYFILYIQLLSFLNYKCYVMQQNKNKNENRS